MTNKEKAKEFAYNEYPVHMSEYSNGVEYDFNECDRNSFIEGCMAMASWKDEQTMDFLKQLRDHFYENYINSKNEKAFWIAKAAAIDIAIEKLFEVDK